MAKTKMKLATPGKRFGAACIDDIIPFVLYVIMMAGAQGMNSSPYGYNHSGGGGGSTAAVAISGILMVAYIVVECIFFARSESLGKHLLGLKVISSIDGTQLSFWKMLYREVIVKQASNVFLLGYIWIIVDERNRAWHDKILDTYVVDAKASGLVSKPAAPAATVQTAVPFDQAAAPAPAAVPVYNPAPAAPVAPAVEPVAAAAPVVEPAPAAAPAAAPVVEPAPAPAAPEVHTRNTKPAVRLELDDEPAVAVDVEVPAAPEVKANMSMKKEELLALASRLGVSVSTTATKAEIIEAIQKAGK